MVVLCHALQLAGKKVDSFQLSVRQFVASENRDGQLFMLSSLKTSQSLTSNVARIRRLYVASEPVSDVKDNVAHKVRRYTSFQ